MNCRKNINYTLELLKNGNLNIYEGTTCTSRTLRWQNVSVKDAVEAISGWIVPWVEAVMEASTLTGNYKTCPYAGSYLCLDCFYYDTCYLDFDDEILELVPEDTDKAEIEEAIVALGTSVSCGSFAILRSSSTGLFVIQHTDDNDNTMELIFPDAASAINLFLALCAGTVTVKLG